MITNRCFGLWACAPSSEPTKKKQRLDAREQQKSSLSIARIRKQRYGKQETSITCVFYWIFIMLKVCDTLWNEFWGKITLFLPRHSVMLRNYRIMCQGISQVHTYLCHGSYLNFTWITIRLNFKKNIGK